MSEYQYNPDAVSHPGETLKEWFFENDLTTFWLAEQTRIKQETIVRICLEEESVTKYAAAIAVATRTTKEFWINRQKAYDECKERRDG